MANIKLIYTLIYLFLILPNCLLICSNKHSRKHSKQSSRTTPSEYCSCCSGEGLGITKEVALCTNKYPRKHNRESHKVTTPEHCPRTSGKGLGVIEDLELGISRARSISEGKLCDSLSSSIENQTTLNHRLAHAQEEQTHFQSTVYKNISYSRKTAIIGTLFSIAYTTTGFIWQNWPTISATISGKHGNSNSTSGTNSTGF